MSAVNYRRRRAVQTAIVRGRNARALELEHAYQYAGAYAGATTKCGLVCASAKAHYANTITTATQTTKYVQIYISGLSNKLIHTNIY